MRFFGCPQGDTIRSEAPPAAVAHPRLDGAKRPDERDGNTTPPRAMGESEMRALCQEHTSALFRYVLGLTALDRYLAEDVVQETLLRAWQNSQTLAARHGSVRPWLFTVARNIVVDRHRAKRARPTEVGDETLATTGAAIDDLDTALTVWTVQEALSGLSRNHREVLVEIYFRGHSVAETATVLDIPPGTVKSRTYYAMRALRNVLEERGLAPGRPAPPRPRRARR